MSYKQHYLRGYSKALDFFEKAAMTPREYESTLRSNANEYAKSHGYLNMPNGASGYDYYEVPKGLQNAEYQAQDIAWQQKLRAEQELHERKKDLHWWNGGLWNKDYWTPSDRSSVTEKYNQWKQEQAKAWAKDVYERPISSDEMWSKLRSGAATGRYMPLPTGGTYNETMTQLQNNIGLQMADQSKQNYKNRNQILSAARSLGYDPNAAVNSWYGYTEWFRPDSPLIQNTNEIYRPNWHR